MAYTEQQLVGALQQADSAGNTQDAEMIAGMIRDLRGNTTQQPQVAPQGAATPQPSVTPAVPQQPTVGNQKQILLDTASQSKQQQGYQSTAPVDDDPMVDRINQTISNQLDTINQRFANSSFLPAAGQYKQQEQVTNKALGDGIAQGATLGFEDELGGVAAGIGSLATDESFGDAYTRKRDQIRTSNEQSKQDAPVAYGVGEVVGAVPTAAVPLGTLTKAATTTGRVAKTAAVAGAEGAIAGAGISEGETLEEIGKDAAIGGAISGVASPLLGGILGGATNTLAKIPWFSSLGGDAETRATNALRNYAKDNDLDVDSVVRDLNTLQGQLGDEYLARAVLADADNPTIQALVANINANQAVDPNTVNRLQGRAGEQGQRLVEQVDPSQTRGNEFLGRTLEGDDILPNPFLARAGRTNTDDGLADLTKLGDDIVGDANEVVAQRYNQAYQDPITSSDLGSYKGTTEFKDALQQGTQTANSKHTVETGSREAAPAMQRLDETKRVIDTMYSKAKGGERSLLGQIRSELIEDMRRVSPAYGEALDIGSDARLRRESIEEGYKALGGSQSNAADMAGRANRTTQPYLEAGVGRAIRDTVAPKLEKGARDGKTGNLLTNTQVANYNALVSEPKADTFTDILAAQEVTQRTANIANLSGRSGQELHEGLRVKLGGDELATATIIAGAANPSVFAVPWIVNRLGASEAAKKTQAEVLKEAQKLMYNHLDESTVKALFSADLESIPADQLSQLGKVLGLMAGPEAMRQLEDIQ
ncbi:hypothetical protein [Vibrio splendidus]|uniref:hypothetical protein n=1 Tax=Vibrio splendidus TaxID=29497 RepID=UPI000D3C99CE|nr:hypothetical protein [Vibrio splendidus]PTP95460.1 hypothetical protein CWO02_01055 [Vibrio splendidus]